MLSKAKLKLIRSLELKKNRTQEGLFVAEGPKVTGDLLPYFPCRLLIATSEWLSHAPSLPKTEVIEVTQEELAKASFLRTPQEVLGVFEMRGSMQSGAQEKGDALPYDKELVLALDDVQDPGNLGTIIRIADWFGIRHIICSTGTADAFSPKVVQATMGAIARVKIHYTDLPSYLSTLSKGTPVYGTFLEGNDIYTLPLSDHGIIVMGNEGNGISPATAKAVTDKLFIPNWPEGAKTSESLNVAVATAITCSEFRRRR